jgi:hypothetical protein
MGDGYGEVECFWGKLDGMLVVLIAVMLGEQYLPVVRVDVAGISLSSKMTWNSFHS